MDRSTQPRALRGEAAGRGGGVVSAARAVMSRICHSHLKFHICPHDRTTLASIFRCQRVCYLQHPPTTLAFPSKNAFIRAPCACRLMHTKVCVGTKPPGCGGGGRVRGGRLVSMYFLPFFSSLFLLSYSGARVAKNSFYLHSPMVVIKGEVNTSASLIKTKQKRKRKETRTPSRTPP